MVKREAVKSIETQKLHMVAALHANSAFDESQQGLEERTKRIKSIEQHFNKAIEIVYNPELHQVAEIDWTNPFWAAAQRAQQRRLEKVRGDARSTTVASVIEQQDKPQPKYDQN